MDNRKEFLLFLDSIEQEYAGYFKDPENKIDSIKRCFVLKGNYGLSYAEHINLRTDIREKVLSKFKDLHGNKAVFDTIP